MTNTNLALTLAETTDKTEVNNQNLQPANDNHDLELSSQKYRGFVKDWIDSKIDDKNPANDNGDDPKTPDDHASSINISEILLQGEELIKQLDKNLQEKGLTEEEFNKLFDSAYKKAEDFLRHELALADVIKKLPTAQGFRTDKTEGVIYTKEKFIEEKFKMKYRTALKISKLTPECVEKALAYGKEYKELPTSRLALLFLKQDDLVQLHQEILKAKEDKKKEKEQERQAKKAQKALEDIEKFNAIQNVQPNLTPATQYNIIYADPSVTKYTEDDLKKILVPASENSVLFMWSPVSKLKEMIELLETWGFTYLESAVWDRMDNSHPGKYFKNCHDVLLVGIKGDGVPTSNSEKSIYRVQLKAGEKKPEYYKSILETMFPGQSYLDLFVQNTTTTEAE